MPILAEEPELFPEDLLDRPEVGQEDGKQWWVVHTRPRQEKSLARTLGTAHEDVLRDSRRPAAVCV